MTRTQPVPLITWSLKLSDHTIYDEWILGCMSRFVQVCLRDSLWLTVDWCLLAQYDTSGITAIPFFFFFLFGRIPFHSTRSEAQQSPLEPVYWQSHKSAFTSIFNELSKLAMQSNLSGFFLATLLVPHRKLITAEQTLLTHYGFERSIWYTQIYWTSCTRTRSASITWENTHSVNHMFLCHLVSHQKLIAFI